MASHFDIRGNGKGSHFIAHCSNLTPTLISSEGSMVGSGTVTTVTFRLKHQVITANLLSLPINFSPNFFTTHDPVTYYAHQHRQQSQVFLMFINRVSL